MNADAIFRAAVAAIRAERPTGVSTNDLHAFLARHGSTLRAHLAEALTDQPVMPVVAPGTTLWPVFNMLGAPRSGERGYRAALLAENIAEDLLDVALDFLEEPELFWAWTATRQAQGQADPGDWWVSEEELLTEDAPWSNPDELPELLEVPRWLTRDRQRSLALSVVQRAMEVEGRAIAAEVQFDGRLPRWAAVGLLADELRQDAPLRMVNVSKATAAAFIEKHHTTLPCINLRGIMYAIGVRARGRLVAVATAGSPTGRWQRVDPRNVLELTRLASDGSTKNAASMLVARLLDLRERSRRGRPDEPALFVTYQLSEVEGAVYRAVWDKGLRVAAKVPGRKAGGARRGGRESPCQRRTGVTTSLGHLDKIRWEATG